MNINEINSCITFAAPVSNFVFSASGLIALFFAIYQYIKNSKWNKLQSKFNFIDIDETESLHQKMEVLLDKSGIILIHTPATQLTEEQITKIIETNDSKFTLNSWCNHFQNICAAYQFGLVSADVFKKVHAFRIAHWWKILQPYIILQRRELGDPSLWSDFELVAKYWIKKLHQKNKNIV